jgi:pimeloyl-ACP methyl ester carboxylesterase
MRFGPPVSFARRPDGRHLAYQVVGDGELDLVFLFGFPTNLALLWDNPAVSGFLTRLSSFSRLILCDRLGNGLSDRGPTGHVFEDWMDDLRCVLAAVGSERAALFGYDFGGRLALLLAATYPNSGVGGGDLRVATDHAARSGLPLGRDPPGTPGTPGPDPSWDAGSGRDPHHHGARGSDRRLGDAMVEGVLPVGRQSGQGLR